MGVVFCQRVLLHPTPEMDTLRGWLMMLHPDVFKNDLSPELRVTLEACGSTRVRMLSRKDQLALGLEALHKWRDQAKAVLICSPSEPP